mgnify:FL=1
MDDELEMDASGCWVIKNTQLISEVPLRSQSDQYKRLAYSLDAKVTVDDDKQDDILIIY